MNDYEKAVVMAYTGVVMLTGDKLGIFHKYIEEKCGRPIWTHELASKKVWEEIKEKSENDFFELCNNDDSRYNDGYRDGRLDACHAHVDEMKRLKAENNRLSAELEKAYETIGTYKANEALRRSIKRQQDFGRQTNND